MISLVIVLLIVERIAIAAIGLLAAIYGQVGWSIFMGAVLVIRIASTNIEVNNETKRIK